MAGRIHRSAHTNAGSPTAVQWRAVWGFRSDSFGRYCALAADDLATLDVLIGDDGPGSVLRRRDLAIRNTRTIWTATRS